MKTGIHPEYYVDAVVRCACGAEGGMVTGGTKRDVRVEVCSSCHPFWTGEQRIVDTEGRVERLMRRYGMTAGSTGTDDASDATATATVEADADADSGAADGDGV